MKYIKIQIEGTIDVKTGMHIGGSSAFAAIGAVDSPVIKDTITGQPIIPGTSLKGKMRTLLAKKYNETMVKDPNQDHERIKRLFGSSEKNDIRRGRLLFSDMLLSNEEELRNKTISGLTTEVKFENTINRLTAVANPRQIERVIRGAEFPLDIIYEFSCEEDQFSEEEIREDFETITAGLTLLQYDYIGGSGSRGYGKIAFKDLDAFEIVGEIDETLMSQCKEILSKTEGK